MHGGKVRLVYFLFILVFAACAQKSTKSIKSNNLGIFKAERKVVEKLEKEKADLEIRNLILTKALEERKKTIVKTPAGGQIVKQFPEFEELIYDQARTAYAEKDEHRLREAVRILKSNQPHSKYLEKMYFWLAQIQSEKGAGSQALITYDQFVKSFPDSEFVPHALYLKGQIYEDLNLKPQAFKIYSDIRRQFPHSREKHFAESRLKKFSEAKQKIDKTERIKQ